jgi:hypothetical protein
MFFLVDTNKKIIFGWSAKCGCCHIKYIFSFLAINCLDTNKLPDDIENYTTIIFIRNPYKRIISGFLEKYKKNGPFRYLWKDPLLTFSQFVNRLIKYDWEVIEHHHFTPQTTEDFDERILLSKIIKFYDISKIDYEYIEKLYNQKIPEYIINKKFGHERLSCINLENCYNNYVYDLDIDDYIDYNINIKYFYNEDIRKKVFNFYIKDFTFFKKNGFDYTKSIFFDV